MLRPALLAAGVVVLSVPFAYFRLLNAAPELRDAANAIGFLTVKSEFGALRYVHFLALAYLGWVAAGPAGARLVAGGLRRRVSTAVTRVGQQSLAVFVSGLFVAQALGGLAGLRAPVLVERDVGRTLDAALRVPVGLAVAHEDEGGHPSSLGEPVGVSVRAGPVPAAAAPRSCRRRS